MKKTIFIFYIFVAFTAKAQTITAYYDWQWKVCEPGLSRFYAVTTNTDSGWFRRDYFTGTSLPQMIGLYKDSTAKIKNGHFSYYYSNGNLSSSGRYVDSMKNGLWLSYHHNGMMGDSAVYENGRRKGTALGWHSNGYISDSAVYNNDGTGIAVSWFDNGQPAEYGKTLNGKKDGKWEFFSIQGLKAATEEYAEGKLLSRTYYDFAGNILADTADRDKPAIFGAGTKDWQKYVYKNLQFPPGYKLVNTEMVTVVVTALVNEDGSVTDAFVQIPFVEAFDKEALRIFRKTPRWVAAIKYNRKVKTLIRQPVTFGQTSE